MEDERTGFSYTFRSLNIAAVSCLLAIFLVIFCFGLTLGADLFKITLGFAIGMVIFTLCCCIAYFSASGIAFYFREIFQKYVPAWLIISFFGSAIFVFIIELVYYFITLDKIKDYKESTSMFSGSSPRPILPTFDDLVVIFLVYTLILFIITGLVSSISSFVVPLFTKKKEEPYTLLKL